MEKLKTKLMEAIIHNTMKECLIGNCMNPMESQYPSDWGVKMFADRLLLNLERTDMYHEQNERMEEEENE